MTPYDVFISSARKDDVPDPNTGLGCPAKPRSSASHAPSRVGSMRCSSTGSGSRCGVQKEGEPDFADAAEETAARRIVAGLGGFTLAVEEVAIYLGRMRTRRWQS